VFPVSRLLPVNQRAAPGAKAARFLKVLIQFSNSLTVIASEAKQSIEPRKERVDCFAPLAMTLM